MPRKADDRSKTWQLILKPRPEWETEIRAFKEICARNGISMSQELYERAVRPFLRDHHWPPGDSQTVLNGYVAPTEKPELCQFFHCKNISVGTLVHESGGKKRACERHINECLQYPEWKLLGGRV